MTEKLSDMTSSYKTQTYLYERALANAEGKGWSSTKM